MFLTESELAGRLKVSRQTIIKHRNAGMPYIPVGERGVRYDIEKVLKWLDERYSKRLKQKADGLAQKEKNKQKEKEKEGSRLQEKEKEKINKKEKERDNFKKTCKKDFPKNNGLDTRDDIKNDLQVVEKGIAGIGTYEQAFNRLWTIYPKQRKQGKDKAYRAFCRDIKTPQDYSDITRALYNYLELKEGERAQFIRLGCTWFNNWTDYLVVDHLPSDVNEKPLYDDARKHLDHIFTSWEKDKRGSFADCKTAFLESVDWRSDDLKLLPLAFRNYFSQLESDNSVGYAMKLPNWFMEWRNFLQGDI